MNSSKAWVECTKNVIYAYEKENNILKKIFMHVGPSKKIQLSMEKYSTKVVLKPTAMISSIWWIHKNGSFR